MKKKICILNYGLGNILSLKNALNYLGYNVIYFNKKNINFDILLIPGVGSFHKASQIFKKKNLFKIITELSKSKKILGICLGMQLLMTKGYEIKPSKGINLIKGEVKQIKKTNNIKLPLVGYKKVKFDNKIKFLNKFNNEKFYFNHSYHVIPKYKFNNFFYTKEKNTKLIAGIVKENIIGLQFHPEKSGKIGLNFLKTIIDNI